ncbi:glycosyltransferase [Chryseobacterium formosus]|uniref:Glycosyltransferase n=1 Tax=Chryseobacterium formosus TaxID=1537363 RepID=A0ABT3XJK4_9FLAO|nr:glycosyltransferase family 2 protein [Chryseobacterium formosus]MCX8522325.1 glycosyltransferase [Chryseobacterium formosus]
MSQAFISIIVPCYNQENYLNECLESVFKQTYSDWECFIINDGSTDNSEAIAKNWTLKDSRFKYYKKINEGPSAARNLGLEKSFGNWILFLDGDDVMSEDKLHTSLSYSENHDMIISNFEMLTGNITSKPFSDLKKYEINLENIVRRWDIDFNIPIHTILFKRDLIKTITFKKELKAKEDWIFWISIFSKNTPSVHFIDEALVKYRQHQNGISKNFISVYNDSQKANEFIFNTFEDNIKKMLFERLNTQNYILNNENLNQKNYIRQLQNTKVLKYYLKFKSLWYPKK